MTTHIPRPPYSETELVELYHPDRLELKLVQVLLRHGERSPVSARFTSTGLSPIWPYCHAAQRLRSVIMTSTGSGYDTKLGEQASESETRDWTEMRWRRRLETFGRRDAPTVATGPGGEVDGICQLGELTDKGRQTTYDLGRRLRHLYVDQLQFMPPTIDSADSIYLRATPVPRALESVQQAFSGMYPPPTQSPNMPPPTILTRTPADETLYPNETSCRRFAQLARAFAKRAAERWNDTPEMDYLTKQLGKYMPEGSPRVAVDSHPRLSGILDTSNSTLAHGKETRLPKEFYEDKTRAIVDKIVTEEWFAGYMENREYRTLGVGALAADVVDRMMSKVAQAGLSVQETGGTDGAQGKRIGRHGETNINFGMSGCHDTTLAAFIASLGAFGGEKWPPYTSHIAFELFQEKAAKQGGPLVTTPAAQPGWLSSMLGLFSSSAASSASTTATSRKPFDTLSSTEKDQARGHYVRVRFNDRVMTVPACRLPGNHLEGDETFCTLEAFKRVVDGFTPKDWKLECRSNLGEKVVGIGEEDKQMAGNIEDGL